MTTTDQLVHIQGILGSTRQGRFGDSVANWFAQLAHGRDDLTFELIDLRDWPLPFFDSPASPASGKIAAEARAWSEKIAAGDGYVIITPEYNRGYPAVLKNAIDYLFHDWSNKPLGLVGYGGSAGGARALQQLRIVAMEVGMAPVRTEVNVVFARRQFDEAGKMTNEVHERNATQMLDQVVQWAGAMRVLRSEG
jgi:NAD(P)H-dependent FMN reductase